MATITSRAYEQIDPARYFICEADKLHTVPLRTSSVARWCKKRAEWAVAGQTYKGDSLWCLCDAHYRALGLTGVTDDYNK